MEKNKNFEQSQFLTDKFIYKNDIKDVINFQSQIKRQKAGNEVIECEECNNSRVNVSLLVHHCNVNKMHKAHRHGVNNNYNALLRNWFDKHQIHRSILIIFFKYCLYYTFFLRLLCYQK